MNRVITHRSYNGSSKVFLINGSQKHHIQSWESFELGQKIGIWGGQETIEDSPVDDSIIEGVPFIIRSGFKFQANPLDKMECTQIFGVDPDFYKQFDMIGHNGVDFRTKFDDTPDGKRPVYAVLDGTVDTAITVEGSGYGKYIKLIHDGGSETTYAHLDSLKVVKGQKVKAGDQIGISDDTGIGTAAHLHFGFRPKKSEFNYKNGYKGSVDPINYFLGEIKLIKTA